MTAERAHHGTIAVQFRILVAGPPLRSRLVARQIIRFLETPSLYNWIETKPHRVLYRLQTLFVQPEKYIPLDDGSVILFSDEGVVFRIDRNGRSKFIDRSSDLLQLERRLAEGYDVKTPFVGTLFPNADAAVETNCTFVPVYRAYNQVRAKQGKPRWRFTSYPGCGDPNL
jgi:hypothetical protein